MGNKPRKLWIAAFLSILAPGLGQIYNGQFRKALLITGLFILGVPVMVLCLNTRNIISKLPVFLLLFILCYIFAIADAALTARKSKEYQLKSYNRAAIYIGIYILAVVAGTTFSTWSQNNYIKTYYMPSGSMEPTLIPGDYILVDRRLSARSPDRGDVVIFEYPPDPEKIFVKRIVAAGGDTVEIRDKSLLVNGRSVNEAYAIHDDPRTISPRDNFGPATVPPDCYFTLGDNRDYSLDSRFWGFIEKNKIRGIARGIYWSWDHEKGVVRWNRIGTEFR